MFRYNSEQAADEGFGGQEGTLSLYSFWLVLEKMLTYANHVGLFAEEIGATTEVPRSFPQTFPHPSPISACYNMDRALNGTLDG